MSDDLVERVARALVSPKADPSDWRFWTDEARAAIAVVLEQAAAMVERVFDKHVVAAAIRALKADT